jgi:hypothetical protein
LISDSGLTIAELGLLDLDHFGAHVRQHRRRGRRRDPRADVQHLHPLEQQFSLHRLPSLVSCPCGSRMIPWRRARGNTIAERPVARRSRRLTRATAQW